LLSETERSCMQSREPCAEHHPASHVLEVRGAVVLGVLGVVQGAELCRKPVSPTDGCYSVHNSAMCARPQARPSSSSPNVRALKPPCCRASSTQAVANHQAWLAYLSTTQLGVAGLLYQVDGTSRTGFAPKYLENVPAAVEVGHRAALGSRASMGSLSGRQNGAKSVRRDVAALGEVPLT
jgi:hypothetical protein